MAVIIILKYKSYLDPNNYDNQYPTLLPSDHFTIYYRSKVTCWLTVAAQYFTVFSHIYIRLIKIDKYITVFLKGIIVHIYLFLLIALKIR